MTHLIVIAAALGGLGLVLKSRLGVESLVDRIVGHSPDHLQSCIRDHLLKSCTSLGDILLRTARVRHLLSKRIDLTREELYLLTFDELFSLPPLHFKQTEIVFSRPHEYERGFENDRLETPLYLDFSNVFESVDTSISPYFSVPATPGEEIADIRPEISVDPMTPPSGQIVSYYFEFDTTETFTSPNAWRTPALHNPMQDPADGPACLIRSQALYCLITTKVRGENPLSSSFKFPFRAAAMRLPNRWSELDTDLMPVMAETLGFGLSKREIIDEVFQYIAYCYPWGSGSVPKRPADTFLCGMGSCGSTNGLAANYLTYNGIANRSIGGFDPITRTVQPGGGHAALEVFNEEAGDWFFYDPYFGIMTPGVCGADLQYSRDFKDIPIYPASDSPRYASFGGSQNLTLGHLFRFRRYLDTTSRTRPGRAFPMTVSPMNEAGIIGPRARHWTEKHEVDIDFPEEITIHARCRAIFSNVCPTEWFHKTGNVALEISKISGWAQTRFTVPVKRLMTERYGRRK